MTSQGLQWITSILDSTAVGLDYQFGEYTCETLPNEFWVLEYTESGGLNEDGQEDSMVILTGTTFGTFLSLINKKELIRSAFPPTGITTVFTDGSGIAVSFDQATPIPTQDEGVNRMEIRLDVTEWRC